MGPVGGALNKILPRVQKWLGPALLLLLRYILVITKYCVKQVS